MMSSTTAPGPAARTAAARRPGLPVALILLPACLIAASAWFLPSLARYSAGYVSYNTVVVLLGTTLLGANAGLIGTFTVLRGRALLGDVLAHASLPGLPLALLLLGRRSFSTMLVSAFVLGLAGVLLLTILRRFTRNKDDAAMGIIRSVLFGLGIVLISIVQSWVVEGGKAGLDSYILGKTAGMLAEDVRLIALVSLVSLATIVLLYKEFQLASFDSGFARVQGWPALLLDNLQMGLVAVTTVVALPAVGAVLVTALLILPGAAMRFWTERLRTLLLGSAVLGALIGAVGSSASAGYSLLPAGPIIVLVGVAMFVVSLFFAPRRGLIARRIAHENFRRARRRRRLLATLYELDEREGRDGSEPDWHPADRIAARHAWTPRELSRVVTEAELKDLIRRRDHEGAGQLCRLTSAGTEHAAAIVRGFRLRDALLDEYPDQAMLVADWEPRDFDEHLPPELLASLESRIRDRGRLPPLSGENGPSASTADDQPAFGDRGGDRP
jgi:manganese/zinc/iron transport system permease protein